MVKAHIIGCTQGVGQNKARRPQEDGAARMDHNQQPGQVAGFIRKGVHAEQRVQEDQNQCIGSAWAM